jgi:putative hydrolase of the HAD superfamily
MKKHVVFDLDDTLFKEIDFVNSAYNFIGNYINLRYSVEINDIILFVLKNKNLSLYDEIISKTNINSSEFSLETYLNLYRFHFPNIKLSLQTKEILELIRSMDYEISVITDGRSVTQRNKIKALGIDSFFKKIIISEETGFTKLSPHNYKLIEDVNNDNFQLIYVGDNVFKDFLYPNRNGWETVCLLDDGKNIHNQSFDLEDFFLPKHKIKEISDLKNII